MAKRTSWEGLTHSQRVKRLEKAQKAARVSAARKRIDRAWKQINTDTALIAELTEDETVTVDVDTVDITTHADPVPVRLRTAERDGGMSFILDRYAGPEVQR